MRSVSTAHRTFLLSGLLAAAIGCSATGEKSQLLARTDTLLQQAKYPEAVSASRRILQMDHDDAGANRQLGLAHLGLGQLTQAYHYLLRAQASNQNDVRVRVGLGTIYSIEAESDQAREQADRALQMDSANLPALLLLSGTVRDVDDVDRAIEGLEAVQARAASDVRPKLALAVLSLRKRDTATAAKLFRDAAPVAPEGLESGELLLLLGERAQASRVLQGFLDKNPNDSPTRRLLAEVFLADGSADQALKLASPLLAKDSTDVDALVLRGRAHLAGNDTDDGIRDLQRAVRLAPDLAPIHYFLAVAYVRRANTTGARASRDSALAQAKSELDEATKIARDYPEAVFQLAELKVQLGNPRAAIADIEHFVNTNPQSIRGQELLGSALVASGRNAEATEAFRRVTGIAPRNAEGHYRLGLSFLSERRNVDARREFETAVSLSPAYAEPVTQLVIMDLFTNHPDSALARIRRQLALVPRSAPLYDLLGWVHAVRNEADSAETSLLDAIRLDPGLVDAHMRLAELYNALGKFDKAIVHGEQAERLDPKNVRALMALGAAYEQNGDLANARRADEAALAADPRSAGAANNLAYLLSEKGDQVGAYEFAAKAEELAPGDPHIADTFGWILYKRGEYDRALKLLKDAAAKLPESPNVQYHFGMAAGKLGDVEGARAALTKAVNSSSSFADRDEARKALIQLK